MVARYIIMNTKQFIEKSNSNEMTETEIKCYYDADEFLENYIEVQLKFVDCEPIEISDFGYIFKIVSNLPRVGEIVIDNGRYGLNDPKHQYRVIDIKSYSSFDMTKIFYLKRLDTYKKEDESQKTIVNF